MLTSATRQALRVRRAQNSPSVTSRACFSTAGPVFAKPSPLYVSRQTKLNRLKNTLWGILSHNAQDPEFFKGAQTGIPSARERAEQHRHHKVLQRRFENTSDEELVDALLSCKSNANNTFVAGQLFDECDRRNLLVTLSSKSLKRVMYVIFPSTQVWRKSTSIQEPARRTMGNLAVRRLSTIMQLRHTTKAARGLHLSWFAALFHLAEIGHADSWSKAWDHIAEAGLVEEITQSYPSRLLTCRLRALMRQSEVTALSDPASVGRQAQLQTHANQAALLLHESSADDKDASTQLSFALRTVKNAGDFKLFHKLLQKYAGLNLDCPDISTLTDLGRSAFARPHLVNTVLIALSNAGKTSQLVAFFETVTQHHKHSINSESFEFVLKAAQAKNSSLLAQHYFARATDAMQDHFTQVLRSTQRSISSGEPLSIKQLQPQATVTADLVRHLTKATRRRVGQLCTTVELLKNCASAIDQHQSSMSKLVDSYVGLSAVQSNPKFAADLQHYMVQVAQLGLIVHDSAAYHDSLARKYRARRLRRVIVEELRTVLSDDQIKRTRPMLQGLGERHLRPIYQDLKKHKADLPTHTGHETPTTSTSQLGHLLIFNESYKRVTDESDSVQDEQNSEEVTRFSAA